LHSDVDDLNSLAQSIPAHYLTTDVRRPASKAGVVARTPAQRAAAKLTGHLNKMDTLLRTGTNTPLCIDDV
jgi:hypothetical protein